MAQIEKAKGLKAILRNFDKVQANQAKAVERGLVKAGLFLQRESQKVVPVDTGALKNSAFTRKEGEGVQTSVSVGYTQSYAIYVHEDLDARHKPGKIAKYLEKPAIENAEELRAIVQREIEAATKKRTT